MLPKDLPYNLTMKMAVDIDPFSSSLLELSSVVRYYYSLLQQL